MNSKPIRGYNPSAVYIDDQPNFLAKNLAALKLLNQYNSLFIHNNVFVSISREGFYLGKYNRETKQISRIDFTDVTDTVRTQYLELIVNRMWMLKSESRNPIVDVKYCPYDSIIKMHITCFIKANQFSQKVHLKPINLSDLIK